MNIELVVCTATAPSSGGAGVAVSGDSLTVKNGNRKGNDSGAQILAIWADLQASGYVQVVRPSGHDTTRDLRFRHSASEVDLLNPLGLPIAVEPQETMSVTIAGSATAGDVEQVAMLMAYDDLPGINQRLVTWEELQKRAEKVLTLEFSLTAAVGPAFATSEELITAESDLLKANRQYAVLGGNISGECLAVYLKGPDTSNARIGFPGNDLDKDMTSGFFGLISRATGLPTIPVFNSGNKASTYIGCHTDENGGTISGSLNLVLLKQ